MITLLIQLRAMQLFAQHAHNLCARIVFHSDHQFFNEVYETVASDYDGVIERVIGLSGESGLELQQILFGIQAVLKDAPSINVKENSVYYSYLLHMEARLCELIKSLMTSMSPGTEQLIGEIANKSEQRQYKIKQRLKR